MKKYFLLLAVVFLSLSTISSIIAQTQKDGSLDITLRGLFNISLTDTTKQSVSSYPGLQLEAAYNINQKWSVFLSYDYDFFSFKDSYIETLRGTGQKEMDKNKQYILSFGPRYYYHVSKSKSFKAYVDAGIGFHFTSLGEYRVTSGGATSTFTTQSINQTGLSLGTGFFTNLDENVFFNVMVKYHKVFEKNHYVVSGTLSNPGTMFPLINYSYIDDIPAYSFVVFSAGFSFKINLF